ncbi:MAG: IS66 family insertion sequence element accessory protein TnpB [Phycisphaeraceae bacterium]|nr:IS66 family insertion sequence element accessory protein TnpB [Phycisphaeraceae bacterium]
MLLLPASVRVYLCVEPTDMRKGFDSLAGIVRERFGDDPLSGHLFLFASKRADRLKILWWDRDGFVIWCKRLERGTFRVPADLRAQRDESRDGARIELPRRELAMLLEGLDRKDLRFSRRFSGASSSP